MGREKSYRSEGVVLRRTDFGEADRLLTLYTRDFGKIKAIAKGARKPQSHKTGHVELFMRTQFMFAQGRGLDIVTQAELIDTFPLLREDLVRMTYASYAVELLDAFTAEEDPHIGKYELLIAALGWLSTAPSILVAARYYELRLLSILGYQPQLFRCVGCNTDVKEQDQYFSAELGGVLCPDCYRVQGQARPISAVAVKVLRYLQTRSWSAVMGLTIKRGVHQEVESVMHYYLTFLLERNLRSFDFLHRLRREAAILFELES